MNEVNSRNTVNDWLAQLNPADRGFSLDEHGQCRLVLGGDADHCIVFVPATDSPSFYLFQDIWRLPQQVDAATYEAVLALNLLGMDTQGGMLGFDTGARYLVFSFFGEIAAHDARSFCAMLQRFLKTAGNVRDRLATLMQPKGRKHAAGAAAAYRLLRG